MNPLSRTGAASARSIPDPVDLHVGARLRALRTQRRVSQAAVAEGVGLTFQQVQKYERGTNRISASKLQALACFLAVPVESFFEGLPRAGADGQPIAPTFYQFAAVNGAGELAALYLGMEPRRRRGLMECARALGSPPGIEAAA